MWMSPPPDMIVREAPSDALHPELDDLDPRNPNNSDKADER
jgi:hypothetical protein